MDGEEFVSFAVWEDELSIVTSAKNSLVWIWDEHFICSGVIKLE